MIPAASCISYPKSGRTWLRYILLQLIDEKYIHYHHDGFEFNNGSMPAHNFDLEMRKTKYREPQKIIYLDRDPRDVMVSLYHQVTGRFADYFHYTGTVSEFLRDDYFGAHNLQRFREMWFEILTDRPFLHISYEQLHRNPIVVIDRVITYLGLNAKLEDIRSAVVAGNIDNMRKVEVSGDFSKPWLQPRNGHTKVRKGVVGNYLSELSNADIDYLDSVFQPLGHHP